ncbi:MAG: hypothetical protein LBI10_11390 [Deltaproteobacteria bacterium]|nr:hypothetical protein [Deltaproteobacteria bacterium]
MVFVIIVMMLTSLMGLIIMVNTRSEVTTSGHHRRGLEAFNSADSAAKMANLFARILLHPVLGVPSDVLSAHGSPQDPMTVEFNADRFDMETLFDESEPFKFTKRYLETGVSLSPSSLDPHIVFKVDDEVVATAVVNLDTTNAIASGYSLNAIDLYDKSGGPSVPVDMVVTVRGNTSVSSDESDLITPQSLITTIMREIL